MAARGWPALAVGTVAFLGLLGLSLENYLLFHTVVELANVVVAFGIFTLAWNFRRSIDNGYFLVVGFASLFIGTLGLLHTLAYKGMGVFPAYGANLPTQLWVAQRYLTAVTLVAAPLAAKRRVRTAVIMGLYTAATLGLVWATFTGHFPDAYLEGQGLTLFKKASEYIAALLLAAGLGLLLRQADAFDRTVLRLQAWSVAASIAAGLAFTLYVGVYDWLNMLGHLLALVSCYLMYGAMLETGLTRPYNLLFRNLKQSEEELRNERNFVSAIVDRAGTLMLVLDREARIVRFNRACEELTGYTAAEVIGQSAYELLVPPGGAQEARVQLHQLFAGGDPGEFEQHWMTRSGEDRVIWCAGKVLQNEDGEPAFAIFTGTDVTERRLVEAEMKARERRLRAIVESVPTGMLLIDRQTHTVVDANPATATLVGLPREQIIGKPCRQFLRCADQQDACPLDRLGTEPVRTDLTLLSAAGKEIPVRRTVTRVMAEGHEQLLESFIDITEQKHMEEELRNLAMVDEVTGLYNRRGFLNLAQKEIDLSLRLNRGMILMSLELEGLKHINDTWGHREGERAIKAAAHILREAFGQTGLVACIGGDEFVVLAPEYVGMDIPLLTARLNRHVETYNCTVRRNYEIRFHMGAVRLNPAQPRTLTDLLNQADTLMYVQRRRHEQQAVQAK